MKIIHTNMKNIHTNMMRVQVMEHPDYQNYMGAEHGDKDMWKQVSQSNIVHINMHINIVHINIHINTYKYV